jgi:methylmalonyl-CoA mutase cobalamin-binding subunit
MIAFARDGRGACKRLGRFDFEFSVDFLNSEQKAAVEHVLHSQSRVMVVSGGAGVGKTTLMQEAVRGIEEGGHRAFTFAPSAASSRGVLRSEGFENADTVARLLIDEELQQAVENQVIWIDEAGLLGARSMAQVFQVAEEKNARVVLSGDVRQHSPVERGDALRVLQEHAGIQAVEVRTIQRQRGEYREAVDAISRGGIEEGFDRLDALGAVVEIDDESRHEQLAQDYLRTVIDEGRTALVVSPTHREGEAVTERIREGLREQGVLGESERILVRQVNCSWTEAERADAARYEPGMVVQFHQNAKDYRGKRPMLGMTPKGNVSLVQEYLPEDRRFQLDYDYKGQVSVVGRFEQKGIKRGEKFVVTGRDEDGNVWMRNGAGTVEVLPLDQAKKFQVYEAREIGVSRGDHIRISQNGFTKDKKHRLNNGAVYEVAGFTSGGDLRLANGWVVSQDYGNLAHGYCVTSHASQGKTVDRVFVAQGAESFPAASAEQFYVSVSRGRESVAIYTDDREELLEAVRRSGRRQAASELEPEAETAGERARWKAAAMWVNRITDQARSWAARARESLVEKYAGRGPARGGPEGSGPTRPPERQAVVDKFAGSARSPEQQAVVDKYTGRGRTAEQQDLVDKYTKRTPKREELVEKYTGKPTKKGGRDDRGTRDRDEE